MSDSDDTGESRTAKTHTMVRLRNPTHSRLSNHSREGETLSGTVGRALDALEREQALPEAVTEAMADD